ncbi:MAG: hypothetical protein U0736_17060 [Gemmataceae bacterium]
MSMQPPPIPLAVADLTDRAADQQRLRQHTNLMLLAAGLPACLNQRDREFIDTARELIDHARQQDRLLHDARCPVDARIERFLEIHFADLNLPEPLRLPAHTLVLDRPGMVRELSLPATGHAFRNELVDSYRVANGVLHNPRADRRTTQGTFHVAEGGLPFPDEKKAVPRAVFARLFRLAFEPPADYLTLPFTAELDTPAQTFVSLLLRPMVCPEVPGVCPARSIETRFFAPGSLVSNLDFVESIFGNAGDPYLPENDAALDVVHWSGHTGCVILAPHLVRVSKKELGLPHHDQATDRQRRDGMCWRDPAERYNDGTPFKLTCRDATGVIVTLIADNYFGYCKKEVKTQLSYAANLYGNVEEEHAGGAIAYPSYNLGEEFHVSRFDDTGRTFADVARDYADLLDVRPQGYAVDRQFPELVYIPEDAVASVLDQRVCWTTAAGPQSIPLLPGRLYLAPSGYKLRVEKHPSAPSWRLIGTAAEGTFCHKPCTVSGGGKSEISKSILDYMHYGPIFVADLDRDLDLVEQLFTRDYSDRWDTGRVKPPDYATRASRPILSPQRSLGSVIKLLTPSPDYTAAYNDWLRSLPNYVFAVVYIIKRFWQPSWGDDWRRHFSVDVVNGVPGHELKMNNRQLVGTYLRIGLTETGAWRTFKLRQDFAASAKIQMEDDITASVVIPAGLLDSEASADTAPSCKFAANCEYRLFQRPDDAIHRGLDRQTEADLARPDNFLSNFEPLSVKQVRDLVDHFVDFDAFTAPMQRLLRSLEESGLEYAVSSAHPRLVDGKPSKNPRYLQVRPDLTRPLERYAAYQGARLHRGLPVDAPVRHPVQAVLLGRRNNPPEPERGVRSLAVYNPIHYQELPELFMDFICSLTGKSPSTTGAGSEGALTKGPFNALRLTADLNAALVSYILTGLAGFSTAAGHIGPQMRVDHDISLLIPEVWCRLDPEERDPAFLIANGMLEKLDDFDHQGERILASRLGYRITERFVQGFFGRVFDNPNIVFDEKVLKPETQDFASYVDGIKHITEAQRRVAQQYFDDGSIAEACPPLQALLHILVDGNHQGKDAHHPDVRRMFTREYLLTSDWYQERLLVKQQRDVALWQRHLRALDAFLADPRYAVKAQAMDVAGRRRYAEAELARVSSLAYLRALRGALGADPMRPRAG